MPLTEFRSAVHHSLPINILRLHRHRAVPYLYTGLNAGLDLNQSSHIVVVAAAVVAAAFSPVWMLSDPYLVFAIDVGSMLQCRISQTANQSSLSTDSNRTCRVYMIAVMPLPETMQRLITVIRRFALFE